MDIRQSETYRRREVNLVTALGFYCMFGSLESLLNLEQKLEMVTAIKAYGTLVSSEMHAKTVFHLVSLPWKAVILRHFEKEMRTTPKLHALIAVPCVRTDLQLRFAWCTMGLTMGVYDSDKRKDRKKNVCRLEGHMCGALDCVKTLAK